MAKLVKSLTVRGNIREAPPHYLDHTDLMRGESYTKKKLSDALKSLRALSAVEDVQVSGEKSGRLVFTISENPVVDNIAISGNKNISVTDLRDRLTTAQGKSFSRMQLDEDLAAIRNTYIAWKNPVPALETTVKRLARNRVSIHIEIDESPMSPTRPPKTRRRRSPGDAMDESLESRIRRITLGAEHASAEGPDHRAVPDDIDEAQAKKASPADQAAARQPASDRQELIAHSATWTGQRSVKDHVRIVRMVVPVMMAEIDHLVDLVEAQRFNDPETEAALDILRSLHHDLGELIDAVEAKKEKPILVRIARKNARLIGYSKTGAKLMVVAPAMTLGISNLLSFISRTPIDSTMLSTVFGSMVAYPFVEKIVGKNKP